MWASRKTGRYGTDGTSWYAWSTYSWKEGGTGVSGTDRFPGGNGSERRTGGEGFPGISGSTGATGWSSGCSRTGWTVWATGTGWRERTSRDPGKERVSGADGNERRTGTSWEDRSGVVATVSTVCRGSGGDGEAVSVGRYFVSDYVVLKNCVSCDYFRGISETYSSIGDGSAGPFTAGRH